MPACASILTTSAGVGRKEVTDVREGGRAMRLVDPVVAADDEGESVYKAGSAGDAPNALGSSTLRPGDATRSKASSLLSARIGTGRCVAEDRLREVTKLLAERG